MQIKHLWYRTPFHNNKVMQKINRLFRFEKDKEAKFRLKVIECHKRFGTCAILLLMIYQKATFRVSYVCNSYKILKNLLAFGRIFLVFANIFFTSGVWLNGRAHL